MNETDKTRAFGMLRAGKPVTVVAREIGRSTSTVRNWAVRAGVPRPPARRGRPPMGAAKGKQYGYRVPLAVQEAALVKMRAVDIPDVKRLVAALAAGDIVLVKP